MSYVGEVISSGETHLVGSTLFGTCITQASDYNKIVDLDSFDELIPGTTVQILFQFSNTAVSTEEHPITLNIEGTGAKPLYTNGTSPPGSTALTSWQANSIISVTLCKDQNDNYSWVMNNTGAPATGVIGSMLNLVYPVGAIYLSTSATNPANLFGGTWEQLKDRFLLTAGDSYVAGATGGAATVTLTEANIPQHHHTVPEHTHGIGDHVHQVKKHSHTLSSHTHTVNSHNHTMAHTHTIAHTHSINSHSHTMAHYHGIDARTIATDTRGDHSHASVYANSPIGTGTEWGFNIAQGLNAVAWTDRSKSETLGNHAHNVTIAAHNTNGSSAANTGGAGLTTNGSSAANTGASSAANTGNATPTTGGPSTNSTDELAAFNTEKGSGNVADKAAFDTTNWGGDNGSTTAIDKMPPYLAVYAWKRTA